MMALHVDEEAICFQLQSVPRESDGNGNRNTGSTNAIKSGYWAIPSCKSDGGAANTAGLEQVQFVFDRSVLKRDAVSKYQMSAVEMLSQGTSSGPFPCLTSDEAWLPRLYRDMGKCYCSEYSAVQYMGAWSGEHPTL
jgi:hypothetical protein